jgi:hypothetical protein
MHRALALSLSVLLLAPTASAQDAGAPPALPEGPEIQLSDEPAEGTTVRRGVSRFVVRAPMATVVRELTDFGRYTEVIPRVTESRVVRRTRAGTEVYLQVSLGANLGVLWSRVRLQVQRAPARVVIDGVSLEGNVDRFELNTRIEPVPGDAERTLVECRMLSVPQLPFPSSVFTRENRDALSTMANRFRARVEAPPAAPVAPVPAAPPTTAPVASPPTPSPPTAQPS